MTPVIGLIQPTFLLELELLGGATFLLCSLIGIERQFQRKYAGYRTHVLVGLGSCGFTMVSGYGFAAVLGDDVNLDPSRIAAQIVSGIGFLGAGVIFKGRSTVRGLTTAATIWMAAAIGMACGAGMLSLGLLLTVLHLATLWVVAPPLVRRIPPDREGRRTLRLSYVDGEGVLRGSSRPPQPWGSPSASPAHGAPRTTTAPPSSTSTPASSASRRCTTWSPSSPMSTVSAASRSCRRTRTRTEPPIGRDP